MRPRQTKIQVQTIENNKIICQRKRKFSTLSQCTMKKGLKRACNLCSTLFLLACYYSTCFSKIEAEKLSIVHQGENIHKLKAHGSSFLDYIQFDKAKNQKS